MVAAATTCEQVLTALPECLPLEHSLYAELTAKAHNRRGDALLLMGRTEDAITAFNTALPLAPDDSYILYNRGRAYLALGREDDARADFTAASNPKYNQPKARNLAEQALAALPDLEN